MAIKLGSNPKSFKKDVSIITLDGASDVLTITYIYRTRRDFARLVDERVADQRAAEEMELKELAATVDTTSAEDKPQPRVIFEDEYLKNTKASAEHVMQIASGWDLSDAFNVENLQQLEDEFPGALSEIQAVYQKSVAEVRTKN